MIDYSSLKSIYNDAIDGLLSANGLTVPCSIVYEDPNGEDCPNCVVNPITGRSSFAHTDPAETITIISSGSGIPSKSLTDIYVLYMSENSNLVANIDTAYSSFRSSFPDVLMFVLDMAVPSGEIEIQYPVGFATDDKCFSSRLDLSTYIYRDSGNASLATDSYQLLLNMINDPGVPSDVVNLFDNANSVLVAFDASSSANAPNSIQATADNLITDLENNGITTRTVSVYQEELFCPYIANSCIDTNDPLISGFYTSCTQNVGWPLGGWLCTDTEPPTETITVTQPPYATSGNLVWFPEGSICPICNGQGVLSKTSTETQNLAVIFDSKKFINFGNVNVPVGDIQIICPITLYPQLASASYITVDTNISSYAQHKYTRISDPQPVGLGDNRYIFSNWERSS
jgi:hypothetical protein